MKPTKKGWKCHKKHLFFPNTLIINEFFLLLQLLASRTERQLIAFVFL